MAVAKTQKIQLIGISKHKSRILDALQNAGTLEINDLTEELKTEKETREIISALQKLDLNIANIEYAIKTLAPYARSRSIFEGPLTLTEKEVREKGSSIDFKSITEECQEIEDKKVKAVNAIATLEMELSSLTPFENLKIKLENIGGSDTAMFSAGIIPSDSIKELKESKFNYEIVSKDEKNHYIYFIYLKDQQKEFNSLISRIKYQAVEFPSNAEGSLSDYLTTLKKEMAGHEQTIKKEEAKLKKLANKIEDLYIVHDYLTWEQERYEEMKKIGNTDYSFIIKGWVPKINLKKLKGILEDITNEIEITEIEPDEGETPPVIIKNSSFMRPFESVTDIYGLPLHNEVDPTPYLSIFFIIFFALCLTDAGYGLIMFTATALALKLFKLPEGTKKLVKLLMYGGIVTFIVGGVFGGWFSITPDQVPEIFTTVDANGEKAFLLQQFNVIKDPLKVLILSLALGYIQILLGTFIKFFHEYKHGSKKDALLDYAPWPFILTAIGFAVLAALNVLPESLKTVGLYWVYLAAAIIVFTQARDKKNPIAKLIFGVLSLYNLVGYLSDVLSYSRLLALGLSTAIIGLAVNIIAALMADLIPYVGWIFMILVLIGGHIFNLVVNTLGSFIHSGRLQFVEFFGKFLEGGGKGFKPFSKKTKYIYVKNN
ncbi:hypothetical protein GF354_00290 [Candidatus Peregrinibacteria bacterium]|nr:hypothetical protein [Candidatus Peregrinibacteria bacterium]